MRKVDQLYTMLENGPSPACDEILTAGLALAEPEFFDELVGVMLRRRNEAAWGGLIEHWHRLTIDVQEILQSDESAMLGGIARCMRGSPDARYHALVALEQAPRTGAAYLLPQALRDAAPRVRESAAHCFRVIAELHYERLGHVQSGAADPKGRFADEHEQMLAAVHEVVATFDVHLRVELVEACLWFASELGPELWDRLNRPRTRLARVVAARLEEWNSPRMAAFLLLALRFSEWRTPAQKILREWDSTAYIGPLLRNTHLLADPETASGVAVIRGGAWLLGDSGSLAHIPPVLRPCVPTWAARLGLPEADRVKNIAAFARRGDTDTQMAAVAALTAMERGSATQALRELAGLGGALGAAAQKALDSRVPPTIQPPPGMPPPPTWTAALTPMDHDNQSADGASHPPAAEPSEMAHASATAAQTAALKSETTAIDEFLAAWQACRRAQGGDYQALVARLRDGGEAWKTAMLRNVNSTDPRDRMQLLRVLDTPALRPLLAPFADRLLDDPVPAVRDLAGRVLGAAATAQHRAADATSDRAMPRAGGGQ